MSHFSLPPYPRPGLRAGRGAAPALGLTLALACALAPFDAPPASAGTVIRGRVALPPAAVARNAEGKRKREPIDPRDAVVYVTAASEGRRPLSGRPRDAAIELGPDHFGPRVVPVMAGSRVRFVNRDRVFHSLFSVSAAGRVDLGDIAPGKQREQRFERAGVVNLFCALHPAAAGFVLVCPNWYYSRSDASGAYALPPLPRGTYVVHAWHPRRGEMRRTVDVDGRGTLALDLGS